jgi:hypothetical protein
MKKAKKYFGMLMVIIAFVSMGVIIFTDIEYTAFIAIGFAANITGNLFAGMFLWVFNDDSL